MGGCKKTVHVHAAMTCHQYSIHCKSSRMAHCASKQRWAPHRPLMMLKNSGRVQKPSMNDTELSGLFSHMPRVINQDFTE